jgi:hypothetical protein
MPIDLLNPNDDNPEETHKHGIDTGLQFSDPDGTIHIGTVFDRGYTVPGNKPVYAVICEDNIERSIIESNAELFEGDE